MRYRDAACVLIAVACSLVAAPARADTYDATLSRAIAAKERALEINDPAHWEAALRLFLELNSIRATRESKYELAFAAERMQQYDIAVESYQAALDLGLVGSARTRAESFLAEHAARMARLLVRGDAGLELEVGGFPRGALPLARPLAVFGGETRLRLARGQCRSEYVVDAAAGSLVVLHVQAPTCSTPNRGAALAEPAHTPTTTAVAARPTAPQRAPTAERGATVAPDASGRRTVGWTLVGVGTGLAVVAAVMVPVSASKASNAREELKPLCRILEDDGNACAEAVGGRQTEAQDAVDSIATWNSVGVAAGVGAGIGALVALSGGILVWTAAPTPGTTTRALEVSPQLLLSASGVVVSGRVQF